jgi:hypothetical protein
LVEVGPNLCLMIAYVIQSRTLNFDVHVHRKLLEKTLAIKYGIKDFWSYLELVAIVVTHRTHKFPGESTKKTMALEVLQG